MAKHRAGSVAFRWLWPVVGVLVGSALVAGVLAVLRDSPSDSSAGIGGSACDARPVKVVTATSFAPVLDALTPVLDNGADCVRLDITTSDGRAAVRRIAEVDADVWIPDDSSWVGTAGTLALAPAPTAGAGTVVATSPLYMVTDRATGDRLRKYGNSWHGLANLIDRPDGVRLAVRDPASSGDGMVAAGALAEAVWLAKDMDASALWLADALKKTRTVTDGTPALPARSGEVGVVPEYALLPALSTSGDKLTAVPGADHTAMLRYTWYPLASAVRGRTRAAGLERLLRELTSPAAAAYLRNANLRTPAGSQPPSGGSGGGGLPAPQAKPLEVLAPHHVDHVFATWYAEDRKTNLLVLVDVSGSMNSPAAAGSKSSRIGLVRQGCRSVATLLPSESRMGLWEFGSQLDGNKDYRSLLDIAPLDADHRKALSRAVNKLTAQVTGTGLYDTILAAYTSARDAYRPGVPNQVLIFTDGRNEADKNSLSAIQLADALKKAADPQRPILLSVVTFGTADDAKVVNDAVAPVQGYVDNLTTANAVSAVFIHVAAGGLHH